MESLLASDEFVWAACKGSQSQPHSGTMIASIIVIFDVSHFRLPVQATLGPIEVGLAALSLLRLRLLKDPENYMLNALLEAETPLWVTLLIIGTPLGWLVVSPGVV